MAGLVTEKLVPKFCEDVTEGRRSTTLRGSCWDGRWAKPGGGTDGDQPQANAAVVSHRTENFPFSTVKVFVYMVNSCVIRVQGLVDSVNVWGLGADAYLSRAERQWQI